MDQTRFSQKSWNLADILPTPSSPEYEVELKTLKDDVEDFQSVKEELSLQISVDNFVKAFKWEWTAIPHIYKTPFYCYSYSFGNLLALALYDKFKEEGKSFVSEYAKLLSYGGSRSPEKMLAEVGVDIHSENFWQGGFNIVGGMIKELKQYA